MTFRPDGSQVVDYSAMVPFQNSERTVVMTFRGRASGRITTDAGVATSVTIAPGTLGMDVEDFAYDLHTDLPGVWGPGGHASTSDANSYTCTETTLTYRGSVKADRTANITIELTRQP